MIRVKVGRHKCFITDGGFIHCNTSFITSYILTSDFKKLSARYRGWLYLKGRECSRLVLYSPIGDPGECYSVDDNIDYFNEIMFLVFGLSEKEFRIYDSKCIKDKDLYEYKQIKKFLYKTPKFETYISNRHYEDKELIVFVCLKNKVVLDCLSLIVEYLFLLRKDSIKDYETILNI